MAELAEERRLVLLVTGAAGLLGAEIARQAAAAGFRCLAVDRRPPPEPAGGEAHAVDILVPGALDPLLEGVTAVIHAAGITPYTAPNAGEWEFQHINVGGTVAVTRSVAAAGVPCLALVSSVSVYGGWSEGDCNEKTSCRPVGAYACSKLDAERAATDLVRDAATRLIILRLATLYGGKTGNVRRLARWIARRRFFWIGDGTNRKSLIHFEDAARACLLAATRGGRATGSAAGIYNVSAPAVSMREVVAELVDALGLPLPAWSLPASLARTARAALGWIRLSGDRRLPGYRVLDRWLSRDVYDGARFAADYDFAPEITLHDGMVREAAAVCGRDPVPGSPSRRSRP